MHVMDSCMVVEATRNPPHPARLGVRHALLERNGPLAVAQVAPLYESVPPKLYGGTERVVSYITEELVNEGHDVTLYASGDSATTAELRPICAQALRLQGCHVIDPLADHVRMLEIVAQDA